MSDAEAPIFSLAFRVGELLRVSGLRLVLAESCTGGLLSKAMVDIPGISEYYCGSAVTYRNETKAQWLKADRNILNDPSIGPVSPQIAEQMCQGVLASTPEADVAASVTGHLGPEAPPDLDGVIYIGVVFRNEQKAQVVRRKLSDEEPENGTKRSCRQREAGAFVLEALLEALQQRGLND